MSLDVVFEVSDAQAKVSVSQSPADFRSRFRTLSCFSSNISACMLPSFPP